jgi:hypothetical protein
MKRARKTKEKAKKKRKRFRKLHAEVVEDFELDKIKDPFEWLDKAKIVLTENKDVDRNLVPSGFVNQYRSNFHNIVNRKETLFIKDPVIISKLEKKFCPTPKSVYHCGLNSKNNEPIQPRHVSSFFFIFIL